MTKVTQTLLTTLILTTLFNTTIAYSSKSYDDKIMEVTCLGKYTGVFHSFIYVANNQTTDNYYVIRTAWLITYPKNLKKELKKNNVYIYDKAPVSNCGWTLISKISNYAVSYGNIYRKNKQDLEFEEKLTNIVYSKYPTLEIFIICLFTVIIPILLIISWLAYDYYKTYKQNRLNANMDNIIIETPLTPPLTSVNYKNNFNNV